jgi:CP family cyanate transporter-like MFS transporter
LRGYDSVVTNSGEVPADGPAHGVREAPIQRRHPVVLGVVVALVAMNLRPAVASVGPVLPEMRADVPLSGTGAAVLTFLPVLCFGVFAAAAPRLARRAGIEMTLLVVVTAVAIGLAVRVLEGPVLLFVGTVVAGGAIAIGNVLVPPLVKRDFPDRTGLMMGVYTMTVSGSAAVAAGLTVPLGAAVGLGWRGALAVWLVPAVLAAVVWLPRARAHTGTAEPSTGRSLRRSALAWQVTIYFGLQSLSYYAVLAWLPSIYRDHGFGASVAGVLLSVAGQPDPMAPLEVTAGRRSRSARSLSATITVAAQTWPGSPSMCRRTGSLPHCEPSTTARKTVPGFWPSCGAGPPAPVTATPRSASSRSRTPTPIACAASAFTTGPSATCSTVCLTSLA